MAKRKHEQAPCAENHDRLDEQGRHCNTCDGGLFTCAVCGLSEGELTYECPGYACGGAGDLTYACKLDFVGGRWVGGDVLAAIKAEREEARRKAREAPWLCEVSCPPGVEP